MNNLNRITLLGNTGRDVKTAATAAGKPVTRFSVATNKRYKDNAGEWKTEPVWHKLVVFGDSANYAAKIKPGSLVYLEGEMTYRDYDREVETPEGPVKVQWPIAEIVASSISALNSDKADKQEKGEAAQAARL
jgi:single-strand DNA-binding protein